MLDLLNFESFLIKKSKRTLRPRIYFSWGFSPSIRPSQEINRNFYNVVLGTNFTV